MNLNDNVRLIQARISRVPILMYHSISGRVSPKFKPFAVSPQVFAEHIAYLYQQRYTSLTVSGLVRELASGGAGLPERVVVLTFDDGFADFYSEALPVLTRYAFTATLYVTTAYIGETSRWLQREEEAERSMLTWEQLREISACGIECGAHSHSHPQLDTLTPAAARSEIVRSKRLLEEQLGREVVTFAYPYGYSSAGVRRWVQEAGFTSACAVKHALSSEATNPFALARLMVNSETSVDALAALVEGRALPLFPTLYVRARTQLWQMARRSSASLTRLLQERLLAR